MTEHDALLAAVLAAPADDLPRLVYADWLDEHGDPDRAEFIWVQCELARLLDPVLRRVCGDEPGPVPDPLVVRHAALRRREEELFAPNADRWFPVPTGYGLDWHITLTATDADPRPRSVVDRGFVAEVRLPAADLSNSAIDLFRRHPITRVRLTTPRPSPWIMSVGTGWVRESEDDPGPRDGILPAALFDRLTGGRLRSRGFRHYRGPRWGQECADDTSAACVGYGREQAGLPALT